MSKKVFKKFVASLMVGGVVFCLGSAFAHEYNNCTYNYYESGGKGKAAESIKARVKNERELQTALNKETVDIVLTADIELTSNLIIPKGCCTINLDNHTIKFKSPTTKIIIGEKHSVSEPYTVVHPGHYTTVSKTKDKYATNSYGQRILKGTETVYETVWIPAYSETKYRTYDVYDDNVKVTLKNGFLIGKSGKDGENATKKKFFRFDVKGANGETPEELIKGISGDIHLSNLLVVTGNGGNGGNGYYSSECHVPLFGRGNGGNGGKGGNGGNAIFTDRANVTVSKVHFKLGKGGCGGKGSKPNPNYWLISGSKGKRGDSGDSGVIINNFKKFKTLA